MLEIEGKVKVWAASKAQNGTRKSDRVVLCGGKHKRD